MAEINNNKPGNKQSLYQTAVGIAVVGGLFSVLIIAVLGLRYFRYSYILPMQENRLAQIKTDLASGAEDEALLEQFRELDFESRKIRIQWYDFASMAGYPLLFNLAVLLIGAKLAKSLQNDKPMPVPGIKYSQFYVYTDSMSRRAVMTAFVLVGGMTIVIAMLSPEINYFAIEEDEEKDIAVAAVPGLPSREEIAENWPRFRGPGGLGVSQYTDIPHKWDIETGKNILWKSPIPLEGRNSPIVWQDRVFLTGATETQKQVYCYDAASGELLWQADVPDKDVAGSELDLYPDTGYAASTAYTDGYQVYAFFPTGDVAAFDYDGNRQWVVNLGQPDNIYGHATSVVGYEDKIIIQYDNGLHDDDLSWLIALDWQSGETVWRTPRAVTNSWTTPIIIETQQGNQLITVSEPYLTAYNPDDGLEIWRTDRMSGEIAPSPIYDNGLVMVISPYVEMAAVEPGGDEMIDESYFKWTADRGIPDIASPVSDGQRVYLLSTYGGALAVHSIQDGNLIWQDQLGGEFHASPSIVGDKVYLFSIEGVGYVLEAADEFVKLAENPLGQEVHASPAFVEGRMYIRGEEHLFCIGYSE